MELKNRKGSFDKFGESGKVRFNNLGQTDYPEGNFDNINVSVTHGSGVPDTDVKWIDLRVEEVN